MRVFHLRGARDAVAWILCMTESGKILIASEKRINRIPVNYPKDTRCIVNLLAHAETSAPAVNRNIWVANFDVNYSNPLQPVQSLANFEWGCYREENILDWWNK